MPIRSCPIALAIVASTFACSSGTGGAPDAGNPIDAGTSDQAIADGPGDALVAVDAGTITFTPTGSLHVARNAQTATLLANGQVLVVGGEDYSRNQLDSIELYDPPSGTWTEIGHLPAPRSNHTAVLLGNGKILVAGGGAADENGIPDGVGVTDSVVLIDPSTTDASTLVTATDSLKVGRSHHIAALLPNGNVLVAGGSPSATSGTPPPLAEAEVYDATQNTWSVLSASLPSARAMAASAVVAGKVVIVGGYTSDGTTPDAYDVFDPTAQSFSSPGSVLGGGRVFGAMATLAGGNSMVLVGGYDFGTIAGGTLDDGELYTAGAWQTSGSIGGDRDAVGLVALPDGRAVSVGGFTDTPEYQDVAIVSTYIPSQNAWYTTGALKTARSEPTATLLQDGRILVVGGFSNSGVLASCELSSVP
jgi:large repetitive protein